MKTIDIYGEIGFDTRAEQVVEQFRAAGDEPVTLAIASEGGSVFEGLTIASAIRDHPAPVTAEVQGYALSMAANLALECESVATYEDSFLMFHEVHGGTHGSERDHDNTAKVMAKMNDHTARRLAKATGADKEQMREALAGTLWLDGKEAFQAGIVDDLRPALALAAKFDIDDLSQTGHIVAMTDKIREILGLSKKDEEAPPVEDTEALREEIANHLAEIQLQNEAIQYAREHIEKLEKQLKEVRQEAQAKAYQKLAAAGHDSLDIADGGGADLSLLDEYRAMKPGAERREFRKKNKRALETALKQLI